MIASRGMGDINPLKMPNGKKKKRRDNTDFESFAKGGKVWDTPNPSKKPKELSSSKKQAAKARAKKAGRPYPNLIDNMWAAK